MNTTEREVVALNKKLAAGLDQMRLLIGGEAVKRVIPLSELQPCENHITILPGGHVLLDATEDELQIIALYAAAMDSIKPPLTEHTTQVMNTNSKYFAAYYIPNAWVVTEYPTRKRCIEVIQEWRDKFKFDHPMKIITITTTEEEA